MFTSKRWVCQACGRKFESKNEVEKHIATCSKVKTYEKKERIKLGKTRETEKKVREEENKKKEDYEKFREAKLKELEGIKEKREKFQELLEEDKLANPHLSLISSYLYNNNNQLHTTNEHLWWVALGVKIGLIMMALSMFSMFLILAG